jgi:hypothetical protein
MPLGERKEIGGDDENSEGVGHGSWLLKSVPKNVRRPFGSNQVMP